MAAIQQPYQTRTGITNANFTTNYVFVDIAAQASIMGVLTAAGSPSSATLEYTLDRPDLVVAGTANWVSDFSAARSATFGTTAAGPVTAVRLSVAASGGTWTMVVLQAYDAGKVN
jgi:hypothetical protein